MKCQSIQKFICSSCFTAKRKIKNGLFPLKYLILGFHPNTTLSFFLCLIFPYNVFSKLKSNFYRVVAFLRAVYYMTMLYTCIIQCTFILHSCTITYQTALCQWQGHGLHSLIECL